MMTDKTQSMWWKKPIDESAAPMPADELQQRKEELLQRTTAFRKKMKYQADLLERNYHASKRNTK